MELDYAPSFQMGHPLAFDFAARLARISPWFIPAVQRPRPGADEGQRSFGSGAQVVVRGGRADADKAAVLAECLDRAGLDRLARRARSAAIRRSAISRKPGSAGRSGGAVAAPSSASSIHQTVSQI